MESSPKVSVILLNWNQYALTAACIESLRNTTWKEKEIIVVDQNSADGSGEELGENFPDVKVILSGSNLGFTGGNNLGIAHSDGKYILLLNNDTEVKPDFFRPLVEALEADSSIGAACPKILFYDHPDRIQYAGGPENVDLVFGRNSWKGWNEVDRGQHDTARETSVAHGAAFFVRRSVVDTVGALDHSFFIFYEEVDWSLRIRAAGHRILFVPASVVLHKESMTVRKDTTFRLYYMTANKILLTRKHCTSVQSMLFFLYFGLVSAPVNLARFAVQRRIDLMQAYIKGTWRGFTTTPGRLSYHPA
jgi:GT2 family glycosyltransferase